MSTCVFLASVVLACAVALPAAAGEETLPPGESLLGADPLAAFRSTMITGHGEVERIRVEGQAFPDALRCRTLVRREQPYHSQLTADTIAPVKRGDVILATFHARAVESDDETGEAVTEFVFERGRDPWTKSKTFHVRVGKSWRRIDIPFESAEGYGPGRARACLRLGFGAQVIEIGGFELTNYGTKVPISKLPVTIPTYRGSDPDAAWRAEAAERIERHRKGDVTVRVIDARGRPVRGADVRVRMTEGK